MTEGSFKPISEGNEKSLAIMRKDIEAMRQSLDADIDVEDEIPYTDDKIERLLKKLPVVMYHAAEQIVLRLAEYKEAKRRLKKTLGNEMAIARLNPLLTAVGDRKAAAENSQIVEDEEINVINAEANYRMAEYRYTAYDNLYTAIKKLSQMRIERNKAERDANRT